MKSSFRSILIFSIFLCSCTQTKVDTKRAFRFFDSVNYQIGLNTSLEQPFIDELNEAISDARKNENAPIDKFRLEALMRVSASVNFAAKDNIQNLIEVDTDINFKKKALDYYTTFSSTYKNELKQTIQILAVPSKDRFQRVINLLVPKLQLIKEKEIEMKNAQKEFRAKYERIMKLQTRINSNTMVRNP